MHAELAGHDREGRALLVPCRGQGDRLVGHLAYDAPTGDTGLVEVVDDGGPVDFIETGESLSAHGVLDVALDFDGTLTARVWNG